MSKVREEQVLLLSGTDDGKEGEIRYLVDPVTKDLTLHIWSREREGWVLSSDDSTTIHRTGLVKLVHFLKHLG